MLLGRASVVWWQQQRADCLPHCTGRETSLIAANCWVALGNTFANTTETIEKHNYQPPAQGRTGQAREQGRRLHPTVSYTVAGTQALRPHLLPAGKQALKASAAKSHRVGAYGSQARPAASAHHESSVLTTAIAQLPHGAHDGQRLQGSSRRGSQSTSVCGPSALSGPSVHASQSVRQTGVQACLTCTATSLAWNPAFISAPWGCKHE